MALPAIPGLGLAVALAVALAGCAPNDASFGERQELANMTGRIKVPATRPSTLLATFRKHCVETASDTAARTALLRASDYVPMGPWRGGIRAFVVADMRPMVILSDDGEFCAVRAAARAGQTNAIETEVARQWPSARPVAMSGVEAAWITGPEEMVGVTRHAGGPGNNEITLALMRR